MSGDMITAGQVWLSKTDPLQLHRIVIDRCEMERPDDSLGFVFAHNKRTGRRTRLRAGVLRHYYRLEDPEGGDHG